MLLMEARCEFLHKVLGASDDTLGLRATIALSIVHRVISPGVLKMHELGARFRIKLLASLPVGTGARTEAIHLRLNLLDNVVPVIARGGYAEFCCHQGEWSFQRT